MENTKLFTMNIKSASEEEIKTYQCLLTEADVVTVRTALGDDSVTPKAQIVISNDINTLPSTYVLINDLIRSQKLNNFKEIESIDIVDHTLVFNIPADKIFSIENMCSNAVGGQTVINLNSIIDIITTEV